MRLITIAVLACLGISYTPSDCGPARQILVRPAGRDGHWNALTSVTNNILCGETENGCNRRRSQWGTSR